MGQAGDVGQFVASHKWAAARSPPNWLLLAPLACRLRIAWLGTNQAQNTLFILPQAWIKPAKLLFGLSLAACTFHCFPGFFAGWWRLWM